MVSVAKKRKMNFSEREVEIIVEEIEKQKHTLVNHFNAGVSHMAKNNAWLEILRKVNAVTTCPRELPEVKKKWSDMKTEVRRKVAQARAAIEGTSTDCTPVPVLLTAMQQRICNLLGEATIISLPAGDSDTEITLPVTANSTTVALTEPLPAVSVTVCHEAKTLNEQDPQPGQSRTLPMAKAGLFPWPKQDSSHGQSRTLPMAKAGLFPWPKQDSHILYNIYTSHFSDFCLFLSGPNYLFKNKACISDVAHSSPQFAQGACVYAQIHEKLEGTLLTLLNKVSINLN
ncbi:nuclear apoptosis-inducing factor 1 isoform X2 [Syngnathus typhle]|uniref:nuclear apoptosis-inducing factor 1 isoform X2 n=1 Tax=Syngnathus typhle TaxID=161592 RepID=UPI002A6A3DE5|nr:nuclear apoptosis-inducing factor 1 isoform X2 [Syngnathus typhle]